jgi:plastocyanin
VRRAATLVVALLLPAVVASCAPSSDPADDSLGRALAKQPVHSADDITLKPPVAGAPTVEFFAPKETEFQVTGAKALEPGDVNISFTSEGNHNVSLAGPGIPVALIWGNPAGEPETGLVHSVRLLPGTYTYYCSVQGHRSAGMVGTLTVGGAAAAASASPSSSSSAGYAP